MSDASVPVREHVPLAPFTTLGVGGAARWFVRAERAEDVAAAHRWSVERGLPLFVLGGGSNVVVADRGWDGLVVQVAIEAESTTTEGGETLARAGAGGRWDGLVERLVAQGLAGVECLSGIPGSVGGTPIQNVGAYGQEVRNVIESVTAWDCHGSSLVTIGAAECGFGYRTSRFRREDAGRFVICAVTFRLSPGPPTVAYPDLRAYLDGAGVCSPSLVDVRRAVLAVRARKGMVLDAADPDTRSVGSFFTNPTVPAAVHARIAADSGSPVPGFEVAGGAVKIPAAWLIDRCGIDRQVTVGGAGLSSKHPLAIVNRGGATARDVLALAVRVKRGVLDRFGISLRPEPVFVGLAPDPDLAWLEE